MQKRYAKKEWSQMLKASHLPYYEQLRADMLSKITTQEWSPGQRIPPEMELCKIYGVSRITVRKAVEDMVQLGHLTRYRGKGTFVRIQQIENNLSKFYSFSEQLKSKGMHEEAEVLDFNVVQADIELATKLMLRGADKDVFQITRLRCVDKIPYAVETSFVPCNLCPKLTGSLVSVEGLYNAMRALEVNPIRAIETFKAVAIKATEARLLKEYSRTPAMRIERLTYSNFAQPVEYCHSTVRGEFFTYTIELGANIQ